MLGGVKRSRGSFAAALALLGVAFYALLLPGHLVSQFKTAVLAADLGIFAGDLCTSDGSNPAMPAPSCPICKGTAAYQLALTPPDVAVLAPLPRTAIVLALVQDDIAGAAVPTPRSRGPPRHA